ncbi:hypothetical protein D3C73_568640 [compost metagenome]
MQPHSDEQVAACHLLEHVLGMADASCHLHTVPVISAQAADHVVRRHLIRWEVEGQEPQPHRAGCEQQIQGPRESFQLIAVPGPEADGHADRPQPFGRCRRRARGPGPGKGRLCTLRAQRKAHDGVGHDLDALPWEAHRGQKVRGFHIADRNILAPLEYTADESIKHPPIHRTDALRINKSRLT